MSKEKDYDELDYHPDKVEPPVPEGAFRTLHAAAPRRGRRRALRVALRHRHAAHAPRGRRAHTPVDPAKNPDGVC